MTTGYGSMMIVYTQSTKIIVQISFGKVPDLVLALCFAPDVGDTSIVSVHHVDGGAVLQQQRRAAQRRVDAVAGGGAHGVQERLVAPAHHHVRLRPPA